MSRVARRLRSMWLTILVGLLTGSGLGFYAVSTTPARAHWDVFGHVDTYMYNNSACTQKLDPITNVFHGYTFNGDANQVADHAGHHGGWTHEDGSMGYFKDHGCFPQDRQRASNPAWMGRYHMRLFYNYDDNSNGPYWAYTLADGHHEEIVGCGLPRHATNSNWDGESGYRMAKLDIGNNWHQWNTSKPSHAFDGSHMWDNQEEMWQCNGRPASNDGWVDYVWMP